MSYDFNAAQSLNKSAADRMSYTMKSRLLVLLSLLCIYSSVMADKNFTDDECLDCHGVLGYAVPTGEHGNTPMRPLDVDYDFMRESVHGDLQCIECHTGIEKLPHKREKLKTVDCVTCHQQLDDAGSKLAGRSASKQNKHNTLKANNDAFASSIHADKSLENNADCATCHTAHYVYLTSDKRAMTYRENSPQLCGKCHQKSLNEYKGSVHGAALLRPWKGESATCSDCHSSHRIEKSKENLSVTRLVTENCGSCHEEETKSYMMTTHGQLAWLGDKNVPKCSHCHLGHDTHAIDDSRSLISKENQLKTCRECHKEAGPEIVKYYSHGNTRDYEKYPLMWISAKVMIGLLLIVLIFFYSHSMLWFIREFKSRKVRWTTFQSRTIRYREKKERGSSNTYIQRFPWYWRLNHWALALSVMTLVFTGMTVMYSDTPWAMAFIDAIGGPGSFGTLHRVAGVVFLTAVFGHAIAAIIKISRKREFQWFGPDSLLPRRKDWRDMKAQFKWFLGKGEQPKFDHWTYWEKFDYWAVYWGAIIIGVSGIMLWNSEKLLAFTPGWVFNIASIAHGVEAFLAVMTLFVVHFFNNHFRPAKFPLDTVMFTGCYDIKEFKEERPAEYERLKASGELENYIVKAPSARTRVIAHVLGFTLLGIGLLLLILVVSGFNQRGLM